MSENQTIVDRFIRNRIRSLGYANYVANEVIRYLDEVAPEIRQTILEAFISYGPRIVGRLRRIEDRIVKIKQRAWGKLSIAAMAALIKLMLLQGRVVGEAFETKVASPSKGEISDALAKAYIVGLTPREWFERLQADDIKRTIAQLRVGIIAGEDPKKILARIVGRFSPVANAAKNAVKMFVETAVGVVGSVAQRLVLALAANANKLGVQWELWVSILDSRTTDGCRELDGRRFKVDEGPQPGYHPYCRSERVPVTADGGDANLDSYAGWIKRQTPAFQKYAGSPFRASELRPLTVDQILEAA